MSQESLTAEQQKQVIITGLHKAAEKAGVYNPSLDDKRMESLAYENDMRSAQEKLSFMGVHALDHIYGVQSAETIRGFLLPDQELLRKDAEKEESYTHKKSKQEKAAIRRGEYADYRLGEKNAVLGALDKYREYQEHPEQALNVSAPVGNEFMQKPDETEEEVSRRMCNIMLSRDKLRRDIADYENKTTPSVVEYIQIKHVRELLDCTEDAIRTWQRANGVDEDGGELPEKEIRRAKHHLPLALEKFRFESANNQKKLGQDLIDFMKEHEQWHTVEKNITENDEQIDQQFQRVHGIQDTDVEDMDSIQRFITSHPDEYAAHKEEVDKAFALMSSRLRRIHDDSHDIRVTQNFIIRMIPDSDPNLNLYKTSVSAVFDGKNYTARVMKYQAESAAAYIKFLLGGRKTDPLHAEFIRRTWGVDAEGGIEASLDELKYENDRFATRLRELREADPPDIDVIRKMERTLNNAIAHRDVYCEVTHTGMARKALQNTFSSRYGAGNGFRDIVRSLTPMGTMPDMTPEYLKRQGNNLNIVKSGKTLDGEDMQQDEAAQLGAMRELMPSYFKQVELMQEHLEKTPLLKQRDMTNLLTDGKELPEFYKKAQGIRDALQIMFKSPVFEKLMPWEQEKLKQYFISSAAMTQASSKLFAQQKAYCGKTYKEYHEAPPAQEDLEACTYEHQLAFYTASVQRSESAGLKREFNDK